MIHYTLLFCGGAFLNILQIRWETMEAVRRSCGNKDDIFMAKLLLCSVAFLMTNGIKLLCNLL